MNVVCKWVIRYRKLSFKGIIFLITYIAWESEKVSKILQAKYNEDTGYLITHMDPILNASACGNPSLQSICSL